MYVNMYGSVLFIYYFYLVPKEECLVLSSVFADRWYFLPTFLNVLLFSDQYLQIVLNLLIDARHPLLHCCH